jgi:hypothetical protein
LYVLYYEAGKINREYLEKLFPAYHLDAQSHSRLIQAMRTLLQHNLNMEETHDKEIIALCNGWFEKVCGTAVPDSSEEWLKCVDALLTQSAEYLEKLEQCLRNIEQDDSRQTICEQWLFVRERNHEPHEFDALIPLIAADLGRDHIDFLAFRRRYFDKWQAQLKLLSEGYDFKREARKLIEDALLKDPTSVLPITGADIISELGLSPGPVVGTLLVEAKKLYASDPCDRASLLEKLQVVVNEINNT